MSQKKTTLTPDDIEMIAEHTQALILESEARQAKVLQSAIRESEARQAKVLQSAIRESEARQAGVLQSAIQESEARQSRIYATKEEMRTLIRDTVSDVVDEKITEKIGLLPTREEFFSRMDQLASMFQKHEQELLLLSHQYQRHDKRLDVLEKDVCTIRTAQKRSSHQGR